MKTHCINGHPLTTETATNQGRCRECVRASNKLSVRRARAANPEKYRAASRACWAAHYIPKPKRTSCGRPRKEGTSTDDSFLAIDVETANNSCGSICQVGAASFLDGYIINSFETLVNPEERFEGINIGIHGIRSQDVLNAPKWPEAYKELLPVFRWARVIVTWSTFDRTAIRLACDKYGLKLSKYRWLDVSRVASRAWPEKTVWKLTDLAAKLGLEYKAHNALEDARCAGEVLLQAMEKLDVGLAEWILLLNRKRAPRAGASAVNPDGPLFGQAVCFTGALSITRVVAANMAAKVGLKFIKQMSEKVSLLVVGTQDLEKLAGHQKSIKHRTAEALRRAGHKIRIVDEPTFFSMVEEAPPGVRKNGTSS